MSNTNLSDNMNLDNFDFEGIDCFCFDVDSTICTDEGIDQLARFLGKEEEIRRITNLTMNGGMNFRDSFKYRLSILNPSEGDLKEFRRHRSVTDLLTPGVEDLIRRLQNADKDIYLVSGGIQQIIEPVAKYLRIPMSNVFANVILFDQEGQYAGFDVNKPTSTQTGKNIVMRWLKEHRKYNKVVMIGDGMTDYEASKSADLFIGFGGNVVRPEVKARSPLYVMDFRELIRFLEQHNTF